MKKTLKQTVILIICALSGLPLVSCSGQKPETITYSVYPYLLDPEYYRECVEEAWYEIHPDIKLELAEYNCYYDGEPEGIDVIMYDATLESTFVENGYVQDIDENDIDDAEDFFEFTLEDIKDDGKIYGIPAILCGDFFIYNKNNKTVSGAEHLPDLQELSGDILINASYINYGMMMDINSDINGSYTIGDSYDDGEALIDYVRAFTKEEYYDKLAYELAKIYDSGTGECYIGYSETLSTLQNRLSDTGIKMISYSDSENIVLLYQDVVGLSSEVKDSKKDYCLELMNIMGSAEVMTKLMKQDDAYSYLAFPRNSAYSNEVKSDELYGNLYKIISDKDNHILRLPAGVYYQ